MTAILLGILVYFGSSGARPQAPVGLQLPLAIEQRIQGFVSMKKGAEARAARKVLQGDLDSDGRQDIVVAFNIEGACTGSEQVDFRPGSCGNGVTAYLVVFLQNNGAHQMIGPVVAGTRGHRLIKSLRVLGITIEVDTEEWDMPNDAMCCPSKKGRATFRLESNTLRELKPDDAA